MHLKEICLDRMVNKLEELSSRVALLKGSFAKQKVSVKLEHYWELECVRNRFAEFKKRVSEVEDADDSQVERSHSALERAWNDLIQAVDELLRVLPEHRGLGI